MGTAGTTVVLGEAVWAAGDLTLAAGECLVVELGCSWRTSSGIFWPTCPSETDGHKRPNLTLIVVGCLEDGRLVSPEFWGFLRETCHQGRSHPGVALQPRLNAFDRGFTERCGAVWGSVAVESSDQISPLSSDISTNSRARILFTTFGGWLAAGLYGPAAWSAAETGGAGSLYPDLPSCCSLAAAAAAMTPRPADDPSAGSNERSGGRLEGSGTVPRPAPEPPAAGGGGNRKGY